MNGADVGGPVHGEGMITTIHTENSLYELDQVSRRVRRVAGLNALTRNQAAFAGEEGWTDYITVTWWGDGLLFVWAVEDLGDKGAMVRQTHTSRVVAIEGPPIQGCAEMSERSGL